jgi:hypothetical protein
MKLTGLAVELSVVEVIDNLLDGSHASVHLEVSSGYESALSSLAQATPTHPTKN